MPQLGSVRIGDDVGIGANTTIDRGALDDTVLEEGVRLNNQIQLRIMFILVRIRPLLVVLAYPAVPGLADTA